MATAPFTISLVLPGDTDIVSQFPGVDRTLRDIINSWMSVDHNTNPGGHDKVTFAQQGVDLTGLAGATRMFSRTDGSLVKVIGAGSTIEFVGVAPGSIMAFGGTTAPNGWLMCDGSAVSRTTRATLFSVIGTNFGVGDNVTTFNLPNLQDHFPVGKGPTFNSVGLTGGAQTKTILTGNLPSHNHSFTGTAKAPKTSDNHDIVAVKAGASAVFDGSGGNGVYPTAAYDNMGAYQPEGTIGNTGSGTALDVMNPYVTVNYIIKV